jgi:hypothetical protein
MEKPIEEEFNLQPLNIFFTDEISLVELAQVLDKIIFNYFEALLHLIAKGEDCVHEETEQHIFYLRMLRDVLRECGQS